MITKLVKGLDFEMTTPFDAIRNEDFIVLTTYRRTGSPAPTTVWFAEHAGKIYITTSARAGKVKRAKNNPSILIAPSDQVGTIHGPTIAAHARIMEPEEFPIASEALRAKYGEPYTQMTTRRDATNLGQRIFMELVPA